MPGRYDRAVMLVIKSGATEIYQPHVGLFHSFYVSFLRTE